MVELFTISEIAAGYSPRTPLSVSVTQGTLIVTLKDVSFEELSIKSELSKTDDFKGDNRYFLLNNDILLPIRGNRNAALLYDKAKRPEPTIASGAFAVIRPHANILDSKYLVWFLNLPETQDYFRRASVGTTVQNLPLNAIKNLNVIVPDLDKQELIGEIFYLRLQERLAIIRRERIQTILLNEKLKSAISYA